MAQFDVYEVRSTGGLAVDVQSELLDSLRTRLVIPLLEGDGGDWPMIRLAPRITIEDERYTLATPFMIGVPLSELRGPVASLRDRGFEIMDAIDLLLTGV